MPKYKFLVWSEPLNIMAFTDIEAEDELEAYEYATTRLIRGATPDNITKVEYMGESKK